MRWLAFFPLKAHAGCARRLQPYNTLRGKTGGSSPFEFSAAGHRFFLCVNGEKGLAWSFHASTLRIGSRKPSSRSGSTPAPVGLFCEGQGCSEYAGTVLRHGGPVNKLGLLMRLSSPWHPPIGGNTGSRKPVHQEARVANLSPRGGVSLPKLALPRLSWRLRALYWEFPCGHSAPVAHPIPRDLSVAAAARAARCPVCALAEARVARSRVAQEVAHA